MVRVLSPNERGIILDLMRHCIAQNQALQAQLQVLLTKNLQTEMAYILERFTKVEDSNAGQVDANAFEKSFSSLMASAKSNAAADARLLGAGPLHDNASGFEDVLESNSKRKTNVRRSVRNLSQGAKEYIKKAASVDLEELTPRSSKKKGLSKGAQQYLRNVKDLDVGRNQACKLRDFQANESRSKTKARSSWKAGQDASPQLANQRADATHASPERPKSWHGQPVRYSKRHQYQSKIEQLSGQINGPGLGFLKALPQKDSFRMTPRKKTKVGTLPADLTTLEQKIKFIERKNNNSDSFRSQHSGSAKVIPFEHSASGTTTIGSSSSLTSASGSVGSHLAKEQVVRASGGGNPLPPENSTASTVFLAFCQPLLSLHQACCRPGDSIQDQEASHVIVPIPLPGEREEWWKAHGEHVHVLLPHSTFTQRWNYAIILCILYYVISAPMIYAFRLNSPSAVVDIIFSTFFLLDVIRNFGTAHEVKDVGWIVGRREIALHYVLGDRSSLFGWFLVDLVTSIPFELFVNPSDDSDNQNSFAKMVILFRMAKAFKAVHISKVLMLQETLASMETYKSLSVKVLLQISAVLVFAHWGACLYWTFTREDRENFYPVANPDLNLNSSAAVRSMAGLDMNLTSTPASTPLRQTEPPPAPAAHKTSDFVMRIGVDADTLFAKSWSGATSFGIQTKPENTQDCMLCLLVMSCGLVLTALLIGRLSDVSSSLSLIDQERKIKTRRTEALLAHLRSRNLSPLSELYKRVRGYCEFVSANGIDTQDADEAIQYFSHLPESLRVDVMIHMNRNVTHKSRFFKKINDPLVTFELLSEMDRMVFMPGDRIMSEGEFEPALYIVLKGSVQVFKFDTEQNEEVLLTTLYRDAILGEHGLLGYRRSATVIAATYCDTLMLGYQPFMKIMRGQPNFSELIVKMSNTEPDNMLEAQSVVENLPELLGELKFDSGQLGKVHSPKRNNGLGVGRNNSLGGTQGGTSLFSSTGEERADKQNDSTASRPTLGGITKAVRASVALAGEPSRQLNLQFSIGDRVRIVKTGTQYGKIAAVSEPDWNGLVKVQMEDGLQIKSYIPENLILVDSMSPKTPHAAGAGAGGGGGGGGGAKATLSPDVQCEA